MQLWNNIFYIKKDANILLDVKYQTEEWLPSPSNNAKENLSINPVTKVAYIRKNNEKKLIRVN